MTNAGARLAAVVIGVAGLLATSVGVAGAAAAPQQSGLHIIGPFSTQAACQASDLAIDNPPEVITSGCFFSQTNPAGGGVQPGWYYRALISSN